jgi:hypothetical protein
MAADVFLWRLPAQPGSELAPADPRPGVRRLLEATAPHPSGAGGGPCVLKIHLGAPARPAVIAPSWAREAALAAAGGASRGPGALAAETLSIGTRGLDTAEALRAAAAAKGFGSGADAGLPFIVGDDPAGPVSLAAGDVPGGRLVGHTLAGVLRGAGSLILLNPVRAHPHLGVVGAVAALGLELADRQAKLRLHAGIRPQVDTPLCAGCGSCLDVCIYDAIVIRAGRATIDHQACTGCGECMGVCFMAGIAPDDAGGLVAFQEDVAEAAVATSRALPVAAGGAAAALYLNFLVHLGTQTTAAKARRRPSPVGIGILASRDPVALDAATFAVLEDRLGAPLPEWTGYAQGPGALLARAEALGLGRREHRMREV